MRAPAPSCGPFLALVHALGRGTLNEAQADKMRALRTGLVAWSEAASIA